MKNFNQYSNFCDLKLSYDVLIRDSVGSYTNYNGFFIKKMIPPSKSTNLCLKSKLISEDKARNGMQNFAK